MQNMSNRQVIADLYKSFLNHDPEPALATFNDDSVWVEPGDNERSGVFRGVVEIAQHAIHCKELTDGTWGTDVVEIVGGDTCVIVVERSLALTERHVVEHAGQHRLRDGRRRGQGDPGAAVRPRNVEHLLVVTAQSGARMQNSLPSGSASTTHDSSPWPMSTCRAPRAITRSTSAC